MLGQAFHSNPLHPIVIIMDERGARCVSQVPRRILREGYFVENHDNHATICRKVFRDSQERTNVMTKSREEKDVPLKEECIESSLPHECLDEEMDMFEGEHDLYPANRRDWRETKSYCVARRRAESRSHQKGKSRLTRRTENARFNLARSAERLMKCEMV